ncbi:IS3 family transposase [Klebsiella pneumoniae]|uniref:IS3 family transposase n=1 Tax=Klebsiella pneumoniae TaxID=573 RepID=UPI003B526A84
MLCHGTVCVVGKMRDLILQLSKSSIYSTKPFVSREIMRTAVFNYIECDYNRWRRHGACGGLSPEQFENQNLA